MKYLLKRYLLLVQSAVLTIVVLGCSYEFPKPVEKDKGSLGSVDLARPVFLGGTLFSGVQNGALTENSVPNAIPQILYSHFSNEQFPVNYSPNVNSLNGNHIYLNNDLNGQIGRYYLQYPKPDTTDFERVISQGEAFQYANKAEEIGNVSFPKSGIIDLTTSGGNEYARAFGFGSQTMVEEALSRNPTFFMLNAGYEDILAYASRGAQGKSELTEATSYQYGDLPSLSLFESTLDQIVDDFLSSNDAIKGALLNIPDILKFPYFIEVRYDVTPYIINSRSMMDKVRFEQNAYNAALEDYYNRNPNIPFDERRPPLDFSADIAYDWGVVVEDTTLSEVFDRNGELVRPVRHAKKGELIFLPVEERLDSNAGNRPSNAVIGSGYLSQEEVELVRNRIDAYNTIIEQKVANSNGRLVMVDLHSYYEELFEGLDLVLNQPAKGDIIRGVPFLPVVDAFGIFSADGINLSARGNALMSRKIVEFLNNGFAGNLQAIDPSDYAGIDILSSGQ